MNIFEQATRKKLRFASAKGELTVEQLWDLPLLITGNTRDVRVDLDTVARMVNHELKAQTEESFVEAKTNHLKALLELKMEIVKHIIADKLEAAEKARKALDDRAERERLMEVLRRKQDQALEDLSPEEIQKRLEALGG